MIAALSALGSFLAPIIFSAAGIASAAIVTVALIVLEKFTGLVSAFGSWFVDGVLDVLVAILTWMVGALPEMPTEPVGNLQALADLLTFANRYAPITEAFGMLSLFASVYAAIFGYKLVKFLRGGG